jgi:hypothetical protein
MQVPIIHHNPHEVRAVLEAAQRCWGIALVAAEAQPDLDRALVRLSDPSQWPDVVLASVQILQQPVEAARALVAHPGRGFFRLVALGQSSDELARARSLSLGDAAVTEPVTTAGLMRALQQTRDQN